MSSVNNLLCAVCECEVDLKACSACGQISYCSVEHQKQNWKEHKGNCKPFRIAVDKKRCRYLEASRDIKSGTIILSENPLCIGPDWSCDLLQTAGSFNCVGCFQPIRVFNSHCPKCKWPVCTTECVGLQNSKLHDIECSLLKGGLGVEHESDYRAIRDYYRTDVLLALKCLLLQLKQPKKFEAFMELQSHDDARKTAPNFNESELQIDYLERNFLVPLKEVEQKIGKTVIARKDRKTLQRILGILENNALYLSSKNEVAGLYSTGCIIEHNCIPNCHFAFDKRNGFKLTVRAARDIRKGEHIATCYSNVLWGTQLRRQQLRETKYFNCCCERCADPTELGTHFSSLRCIGSDEMACEGGFQVPVNPLSAVDGLEWACNKCPVRVSGDQVAFLVGKMSEEIDNVIYKTPNVAAVEALMDKLGYFLHPQHYHNFTLKHSLIQLLGNHKDSFIETISIDALKRKLKLCDNLLETLKRLDPHNIRLSIYMAVVLYERFNSIAEMHRRQLEKVPCTINDAMSCLESARLMLTNELDTIQGKQLNDRICETMEKFSVEMKENCKCKIMKS